MNSCEARPEGKALIYKIKCHNFPRKMVRDILCDYAGARAGKGGVIAQYYVKINQRKCAKLRHIRTRTALTRRAI